MEKIKFIADTASDIPDEELAAYNIDMPSVPIVVDGREYWERRSFTIQEFYAVIDQSKEIPVTSRVPEEDFRRCYADAYAAGYTDVICVTINAGGSGTNASAQIARDRFYEKEPEAREKMNIHVVDSRTYSLAYGYPVIQGAKMAREGKTVAEILDYLDDWFCRVEILLGLYSLDYARKSGRIGAAAAFVGDVLGVRPIVSMIDGGTKTVDKVRGEKNLVPKLVSLCDRPGRSDVIAVCGKEVEQGLALQSLLKKQLGVNASLYRLGASITINAGPRAVAVIYLGPRRPKPAPHHSD